MIELQATKDELVDEFRKLRMVSLNDLHILPRKNPRQWAVVRRGASKASKTFDGQQAAVDYAISIAKKRSGAVKVVIHERNGQVTTVAT